MILENDWWKTIIQRREVQKSRLIEKWKMSGIYNGEENLVDTTKIANEHFLLNLKHM